MKENEFELLKERVKKFFENDFSGHDYWHTLRVYNNAIRICNDEKSNIEIVKLGALLHDVDDYKLVGNQKEKYENAKKFMSEINVNDEKIIQVCNIISQVSFKGSDTQIPDTIEGKIIQDADRLDAIGAIGIARTFAYGGSHSTTIYDPEIYPNNNMRAEEYYKNKGTTLNHFYEKLLLLKDLINTDTAKRIAQERHEYMERFIDEFLQEWNGNK